jgi:hypothetical protein
MLAINTPEYNCVNDWTKNISKTGTFIKAKGVNIQIGKDGIPEGWTVKEI